MRLIEALRLGPGDAAAFVGAGGKSSSLKWIAEESRFPVTVLATTTKIFRHQAGFAGEHHILEEKSHLPFILSRLERGGSIFLTGPETASGKKWTGVSPALLEPVYQAVRELGGILAIEADGARGGSLKAPAHYEPVVPDFIDVLIPVAGIDAAGAPVDSRLVHRPQLVKKIAGSMEQVTPEIIASVLTSPLGGLKSIPDTAIARVMINKVEDETGTRHARRAAGLVLKNMRVDAVLLAALAGSEPVLEVHGRVAAVVLAAGEGKRFGGPKQLQELQGEPLAHRAARTALEAGMDPVIVVTGAHGHKVREVLEDLPVMVVSNPEWKSGQGSSVATGAKQLPENVEAALFMLADMPAVSAELLDLLGRRYRTTLASITAPVHDGRRGNPVLFDRRTFEYLRMLQGDQGGRQLFNRFDVEQIPWNESIFLDIDTREDYKRFTDG